MQSSGRIDSRISPTNNLAEAVSACLDGTASIDDVARAYYADTRVRRLIAHACYKSRLSPDFSEELAQECAVLLTQKFIRTIEDPEKIYNVLHLSACHMARRKAEKAGEDSLDAILERSGEADPSTSEIMGDPRQVIEEVEVSMDRRKAIDEFNRRLNTQQKGSPMHMTNSLRMSLVHSTPLVVPRLERIKPPKQEPANSPSEAGIELNDIRRELGYTVPEFAQLLNTSKGTLSSYLYGIVKNVPESVLKEARLLRHQAGKEFQALNAKFGNLSMRDIVDAWFKSLGIDVEDKNRDTFLATILGVDRATVWRWRERNMRPEPRKLKEYDDMVVAAVAMSKRDKKAKANQFNLAG